NNISNRDNSIQSTLSDSDVAASDLIEKQALSQLQNAINEADCILSERQ
ncbi:unnamed protein product, partial [Didymodactylos carnosus]